MMTKTSHFATIPVVLPLIILKFGQILDAIPSNPAWNSFRNSSARFLSGLRYLSSSLKQHHSKTIIKVPPSRVDPPFFTRWLKRQIGSPLGTPKCVSLYKRRHFYSSFGVFGGKQYNKETNTALNYVWKTMPSQKQAGHLVTTNVKEKD